MICPPTSFFLADDHTKTRKLSTTAEPTVDFKSTAIRYVKGLSEQLHAAYSNKAYALFSSRKLHWDHT